MRIPRRFNPAARHYSSLIVAVTQVHGCGLGGIQHQLAVGMLPALFLLSSGREEVYNILWGLVFGFATLNILSLGARRFEQKRGLNFGELLAVLVVVVSIILLAWEMLYVFGILPIRLTPSNS
ncbi:MAG: hypothetical protein WBS24_04110 [Terriglobales bacterium]